MAKNVRNGETQRQRKTRSRRIAGARAIYSPSVVFPKDWGRAMRRHPPTDCLRCELRLVWFIPFGCYADPEDPTAPCPAGGNHELANGRRPHRYARTPR